MKRIINTLAIAVSIIFVSTIDARIMGPITPKTTITTKRQLVKDTKKLEANLNEVNKATTPEKKEVAKKETLASALEILKDLEERSLMSDITWYSETQIKSAIKKLTQLAGLKLKITQNIAKLEKRLAPITDKGYIWDSAKPGKEKEYKALTQRLDKFKDGLKKVNSAIHDQSVITGKDWANAYCALIITGLTIGVDLVAFGGAGTIAAATGLTGAGSWLAGLGASGWTYTKIVATYGWKAGTFYLAHEKMFKNAYDAYKFAQSVYNDVMRDPKSTEQTKAIAQQKVQATKIEADRQAAAMRKFQEDLAAGRITPADLQKLSAAAKAARTAK